MNTEQLAQEIYRLVFGHVDNKLFKGDKLQEIEDWLNEGDLSDEPGAYQLAVEWREYDADEVERRG